MDNILFATYSSFCLYSIYTPKLLENNICTFTKEIITTRGLNCIISEYILSTNCKVMNLHINQITAYSTECYKNQRQRNIFFWENNLFWNTITIFPHISRSHTPLVFFHKNTQCSIWEYVTPCDCSPRLLLRVTSLNKL